MGGNGVSQSCWENVKKTEGEEHLSCLCAFVYLYSSTL